MEQNLTSVLHSRTEFIIIYEPHHEKTMSRITRKPSFCICENEVAEAAKLISAFVFATRIVEFLPSLLIQNFKLLVYFYSCSARFVSDLVGTKIVCFPTQRLIIYHTPWAVCLYYVRVNICHQHDRHMYQPGFEPAISRLLSEYALHYTTAAVQQSYSQFIDASFFA